MINYKDNSVSMNTNVSIQDAYNAYTNSVFSKNVFWACVPDGVDLGMTWSCGIEEWAGLNPRTAPFGVVFSRLF